jgi:hypothetical protein
VLVWCSGTSFSTIQLGDAAGPSSATDGHAALFDGTSGRLLKSAGAAPLLVGTPVDSIDFNENAAPGDPAADDARLYALDESGVTTLVYRRSDSSVAKLRPALQSEMETATANDVNVSPGRQHHHPGHPKAGGNLNGSGTPAFASGDYGMGSVTDNNTGDYTLALDTAFADTNYWATVFGRNDGAQETIVSSDSADTKTASSFQLQAREGSGTNFDSPEIGVAFWGDYA